MEPTRLAMLGAVFFSWLALIYYLVRLWLGTAYTPQAVILGVVWTFLVSYAAVGVFVCYLLGVAARELPEEEVVPVARKGLRKERKEGEGVPAEMPPQAAPASAEGSPLDAPPDGMADLLRQLDEGNAPLQAADDEETT